MIETRGLGKVYRPGWLRRLRRRAGHRALEGVDLAIPRGALVGLLGPNGAGKTTLMKCLIGLLDPSEGEARVLGEPARGANPGLRARVGVMIGRPALYPYLTGRRNLALRASLYPGAPERVAPLLGSVGLQDAADHAAGGYSTGMKQRLGLAGALVNSPEVLLLDEPTSGLDPAGRREVLDFIRETAREDGRTVLLSSHLLAEVESVCDHLVILRDGRLVCAGSTRELLGEGGGRLRLVAAPLEKVREIVADLDGVAEVPEPPEAAGPGVLLTASDEAIPSLVRALVEAGVEVSRVEPRPPSLEELYLRITGEREARG